MGDEATKAWLEAMQANEPKVYDGNAAALQAVAAGEVDVALVNHYYLFQAQAEAGADAAGREPLLHGRRSGSPRERRGRRGSSRARTTRPQPSRWRGSCSTTRPRRTSPTRHSSTRFAPGADGRPAPGARRASSPPSSTSRTSPTSRAPFACSRRPASSSDATPGRRLEPPCRSTRGPPRRAPPATPVARWPRGSSSRSSRWLPSSTSRPGEPARPTTRWTSCSGRGRPRCWSTRWSMALLVGAGAVGDRPAAGAG